MAASIPTGFPSGAGTVFPFGVSNATVWCPTQACTSFFNGKATPNPIDMGKCALTTVAYSSGKDVSVTSARSICTCGSSEFNVRTETKTGTVYWECDHDGYYTISSSVLPTPTPTYTAATPSGTVTNVACVTIGPAEKNSLANTQTWGWYFSNSTLEERINWTCDGLDDKKPPLLSLANGAEPFFSRSVQIAGQGSRSHLNMVVSVKKDCVVPLTKEYCHKGFERILKECPASSNGHIYGGAADDNCGVFYATNGVPIDDPRKKEPLRDMSSDPKNGKKWDYKHLCNPRLKEPKCEFSFND